MKDYAPVHKKARENKKAGDFLRLGSNDERLF